MIIIHKSVSKIGSVCKKSLFSGRKFDLFIQKMYYILQRLVYLPSKKQNKMETNTPFLDTTEVKSKFDAGHFMQKTPPGEYIIDIKTKLFFKNRLFFAFDKWVLSDIKAEKSEMSAQIGYILDHEPGKSRLFFTQKAVDFLKKVESKWQNSIDLMSKMEGHGGLDFTMTKNELLSFRTTVGKAFPGKYYIKGTATGCRVVLGTNKVALRKTIFALLNTVTVDKPKVLTLEDTKHGYARVCVSIHNKDKKSKIKAEALEGSIRFYIEPQAEAKHDVFLDERFPRTLKLLKAVASDPDFKPTQYAIDTVEVEMNAVLEQLKNAALNSAPE